MLLLIKKSKIKIFFLKRGGGGGGGASEIRQTWGGACPKRLKTPAVACKSLGTPCRICENVNSFNKIREILQNACYFLFSTVLSKIFYIKYVYI